MGSKSGAAPIPSQRCSQEARDSSLTVARDEDRASPARRIAMSVVVRFSPACATPQQYDEANRRVKQERGEELSDGCDYRVAFIGPDGNVRVSEIWDSREQAEAWGRRLMPLLARTRDRPRRAGSARGSQHRKAPAVRTLERDPPGHATVSRGELAGCRRAPFSLRGGGYPPPSGDPGGR